MKKLIIEWKHLDVDGETCDRCYDTGENLTNEIKRLNRKLQTDGYVIELIETLLTNDQLDQSNSLTFNKISIEDLIDITISENYCKSCSDLVGVDSYCRVITYENAEYEDIPAKAIRHAVYKVLELNNINSNDPCDCTPCDCNGSGCC